MKKWIRCVVAIAAAGFIAGQVQAADWGDLTGKFVYDGVAPKPKPLNISKDNEVCDKFKDEVVEQGLLVGEQSGLSNVFIYLRTPTGKTIEVHPDLKKAAEKPAVLENLHCMFYPHVIGVWAKNQTLLVKNSDPLSQAVKIDVITNTPINVIMGIGGEVEQKFQKNERLPATVTCGIHPWESAYLLVHDSPYFAISDKNGEFTIKNIPVGDWEFQTWHEKTGFLNADSSWTKGRFKKSIKKGENALGTFKISPKVFEPKS